MTVLNRVLGIFFFVLAGMCTLLGFLALPPVGLLFALPYFFFIITVVFVVLGSLHLLVERGFRKNASWRWVAQVLPILLLLLLILAFWTW
jgi:hypothetical protein